MELRDRLEADGQWLFQHRSFVPLLLVPVLIAVLAGSVDSHTAGAAFNPAGCILAAFGVLLRACVIGYIPPGTSGRNMRRQRAMVLNTTGLYSLVRHPLYIGNFLVAAGWSLASGSGWLVLVVALLFCLYYERIALREEAFLRGRFGDAFAAWAERTPACIPRVLRWTPPRRAFCWRMVLRREYQTACLVVFGFVIVHLLRAVFVRADARTASIWIIIGALDAAMFGVLWLLIRHRRARLHELPASSIHP